MAAFASSTKALSMSPDLAYSFPSRLYFSADFKWYLNPLDSSHGIFALSASSDIVAGRRLGPALGLLGRDEVSWDCVVLW